ncbi:MAG: PDZ domain-containing protein [Candidatus Polarisedimenticolia bacterium]
MFNVPPPGVGVLVQRIAAGSPAKRLGLKGGTVRVTIGEEELIAGGDIVLSIQGIALGGPGGFSLARQQLAELRPGDSATVTVLRGGQTITLTAAVEP